MTASYTVGEICERVSGETEGDVSLIVRGVDFIDAPAGRNDILTFIGAPRFAKMWPQSSAAAALVSEGLELPEAKGKIVIRVREADSAMADVLEMFRPPPPKAIPGTHPQAFVDESATLGEGVSVGAGSYVGPRAKIGARTVILPNATLMDDCEVGPDCVIHPGVVIGERVRIGKKCTFQSKTTIGEPGHGLPETRQNYRDLPPTRGGNVVIGDFVEMGARVCISRGTFGNTAVGNGAKMDNLMALGGNSKVGKHCLLSSQIGIGANSELGDFSIVAGQSQITDGVSTGFGSVLRVFSMPNGNLPKGADVLGIPAEPISSKKRKWVTWKKMTRAAEEKR